MRRTFRSRCTGDVGWRSAVVLAVAFGTILPACVQGLPATKARSPNRWTLTASPCDGVNTSETLPKPETSTYPLHHATVAPAGETTTNWSPLEIAVVELAALAETLSRSETFAGYRTDGNTVLVRTKDGVLPNGFSRFANVVTFDVRAARYSANEQECIRRRLAGVHDPVCEGVANRISGLTYDLPSDQTVVWLKPLTPTTTEQDVGRTLGVDPSTLRIEQVLGDYPPFCQPCSAVVTTPTTARPDGSAPTPVVTEPCSASATTSSTQPGAVSPVITPSPTTAPTTEPRSTTTA